jgi:hypothetical protein
MNKTVRFVTAAFVLGSASIGFVPIAQAETSTQTVSPSTEAWYQPNPTCGLPVGCVGLGSLPAPLPVAPPAEVPTSPYPAGSMHVAVEGGQETARSYLALSLPIFDVVLKGAVLDVPLDVAQADGSVAPDTAKVAVCTFSGSITAANGSIETPPAADCGNAVPASYVATPQPHLHADLGKMLASLSAGAGLALLPDASKVAPTDAWHVTFSSHDRADAAKTPPASLTITTEPMPETPEVEVPEAPAAPTTTVEQPATTDFPPLAPTTEVPTGTQQPTTPQPQFQPQATTVTVGYAYPTVWLLPLAFLIVIPLVARALTRDLTPVPTSPPPTPAA